MRPPPLRPLPACGDAVPKGAVVAQALSRVCMHGCPVTLCPLSRFLLPSGCAVTLYLLSCFLPPVPLRRHSVALTDWLSVSVAAPPTGEHDLLSDGPSGSRATLLADTLHRGCVVVGGAATLNDLKAACAAACAAGSGLPPHATRVPAAAHAMLRWFASTQVRNVATLAGNVATASPISDMNPLLVAMGAFLVVGSAGEHPSVPPVSAAGGGGSSGGGVGAGAASVRLISVPRLFKAYRRTALQPHEVILAVVLPLALPFEYVRAYKQARRREDDISLVGAAVRVHLVPAGGGGGGDGGAGTHWAAASASVVYAGMAAVTLHAARASAALAGGPWSRATLDAALAALREDVTLKENVPGGACLACRPPPPPLFRSAVVVSLLGAGRCWAAWCGAGCGHRPSFPPACLPACLFAKVAC